MNPSQPSHAGSGCVRWTNLRARVVLVAVLALAARTPGLEVRVRTRNDVPQIHVDGQAVRGRMFFGIPGRSTLPVGPEPTRIEFIFRAVETEPKHATMHVRFGQEPGNVVLDDIRVVEVATGRDVVGPLGFEDDLETFTAQWRYWPPGKQNTVATWEAVDGIGEGGSRALRVTLREPPGGTWPDFHFYRDPVLRLEKGKQYRVSVWARADSKRALQIAFYRPGQVYVQLGAPPGCFEDQIRMAAEVGVDFVSFPMPLPWPEPGTEPDFSAVDAACQRVLDANPRALLLPRISMEPPGWWKKVNPEHVMVWEDGPRHHGFAVASPRYRADAAATLSRLVRHLEELFGESVAGYHPCGQNTGEWFYYDTWLRKYHGYAPATKRAWRTWLEAQYSSDGALRKAWGRTDVSLASAEPPAAEVRHAHPHGLFRSPADERGIIDFNQFQQEAMAECVCALAQAVREGSAGRKLVVFFYGYVFEFGAILNGPALSGHYGLRRILASPDIDVLCSPISYFDRGLGGCAPTMTAAESVAMAGKLWLNEDDTATFLSSGTFPGHRERVDTCEETNAMLVRNVAQEACRNLATWWMDLGGTGWFRDRRLWEQMRRLEAIDLPLLRNPTPFRPEVAAVVDERSMMFVAEQGHLLTRPGVYEARGQLARIGAPFGQYLLDDVVAGRVNARLYVFLNAWSLSGKQRQGLLDATRGKTRVWCHAPGLFDGTVRRPQAMRELTGFLLRPVSGAPEAWAEPTEAGRDQGLSHAFGTKQRLSPMFTVEPTPADTVLAAYANGEPAVAVREGPRGTDVFAGPPAPSTELLRLAARKAGVHFHTEGEYIVYANGPFVAVHAPDKDSILIHSDRGPGELVDLVTGDSLGHGGHIVVPFGRGQTRVMQWR